MCAFGDDAIKRLTGIGVFIELERHGVPDGDIGKHVWIKSRQIPCLPFIDLNLRSSANAVHEYFDVVSEGSGRFITFQAVKDYGHRESFQSFCQWFRVFIVAHYPWQGPGGGLAPAWHPLAVTKKVNRIHFASLQIIAGNRTNWPLSPPASG